MAGAGRARVARRRSSARLLHDANAGPPGRPQVAAVVGWAAEDANVDAPRRAPASSSASRSARRGTEPRRRLRASLGRPRGSGTAPRAPCPRDVLERRAGLVANLHIEQALSGARLHRDRARSFPTMSWTVRAIRARSAPRRFARLRGARLGQPAGLVAHLREEAALLAQHVGQQQWDADDADVGHELECAEPFPRGVGGGDRRENVTHEANVRGPPLPAVGEIDGGRRDQQRCEPSRRRGVACCGGGQRAVSATTADATGARRHVAAGSAMSTTRATPSASIGRHLPASAERCSASVSKPRTRAAAGRPRSTTRDRRRPCGSADARIVAMLSGREGAVLIRRPGRSYSAWPPSMTPAGRCARARCPPGWSGPTKEP